MSVAPAKGEYSPPDREVGMLITGMEQGLGLTSRSSFSSPLRFDTSFARAYIELVLRLKQ